MTVLKRSWQQNLCSIKDALFRGGRYGARMLAQSKSEIRKLSLVGVCMLWVPLIFLVTGQCTPDFFPFEYRSPWCYNFFFFFKETQRGIFMNKVTFPKADKPGLMNAYGIALDTPLGHNVYQGKDVSVPRRRDLALLERQCAVAFPRLPPSVPMFCSISTGAQTQTPVTGESVTTTWEG